MSEAGWYKIAGITGAVILFALSVTVASQQPEVRAALMAAAAGLLGWVGVRRPGDVPPAD